MIVVVLMAGVAAGAAVAGLSVEPGAAQVRRGDALLIYGCAPQNISLTRNGQALTYELRPAPVPLRPDHHVYLLDERMIAGAVPGETRLGPGVWIYAHRRVIYNGCD